MYCYLRYETLRVSALLRQVLDNTATSTMLFNRQQYGRERWRAEEYQGVGVTKPGAIEICVLGVLGIRGVSVKI